MPTAPETAEYKGAHRFAVDPVSSGALIAASGDAWHGGDSGVLRCRQPWRPGVAGGVLSGAAATMYQAGPRLDVGQRRRLRGCSRSPF